MAQSLPDGGLYQSKYNPANIRSTPKKGPEGEPLVDAIFRQNDARLTTIVLCQQFSARVA